MGLDTTHGCWDGSYTGFSLWRDALADAAGYCRIIGGKWADNESPVFGSVILIDWGHLPDKALMGEWPETPADPLMVLIAHSDCDGVIHPAQAGPLAERLAELAPLVDEQYQPATQRFLAGLRDAVTANEDVEFH